MSPVRTDFHYKIMKCHGINSPKSSVKETEVLNNCLQLRKGFGAAAWGKGTNQTSIWEGAAQLLYSNTAMWLEGVYTHAAGVSNKNNFYLLILLRNSYLSLAEMLQAQRHYRTRKKCIDRESLVTAFFFFFKWNLATRAWRSALIKELLEL